MRRRRSRREGFSQKNDVDCSREPVKLSRNLVRLPLRVTVVLGGVKYNAAGRM